MPATQGERIAAVHGFLDAMDAAVPEDRAINAELRRVMERALWQPRLPVDKPASGARPDGGAAEGRTG
jgi:hypothetical protein